MNGIIYRVINLLDKKVYIGRTIRTLEERKRGHFGSLKRQGYYHFHAALVKYGKKNFKWEEIDRADSMLSLNEREIYWIAFYDSSNPSKGYNMTKGGEGCFPVYHRTGNKKGWHHSEETIKRMMGRYKGIPRSEEVRKKISEAQSGEKSIHFGKKLSKESVQKRTLLQGGTNITSQKK